MTTTGLSARDRAVLDFERDFTAHEGGKLEAITRRFGFSPSRYYQLLSALVDTDAAAAYDPLLIRRLRRRREGRAAGAGAPVARRADGTRGRGRWSE